VNNFVSRNDNPLDLTGWFAMFGCFSFAWFGEQVVDINLLNELRNLLECMQFIERTERAAEVERLSRTFQDNPG
jgi:hypothetical protein